jgi:hypothetical protein
MLSAGTPNRRSVSSRRYSETAVMPWEWLMENRVSSRKVRSCPTRVMSVPCSVVITGRSKASFSISRAIQAEVACGMA